MAIAVLADHDQGRLLPATARMVGALLPLELPMDIIVAGRGVGAVAEQAARISGIARVRVADHEVLATQQPEPLAGLLLSLADTYSHIVAVANAVGKDVIPRLAARLDVMPVTDVTKVLGPNRFERPIYTGNAIETVATAEPKVLLTLRASAFRPAPEDGPVEIARVGVPAETGAMAEFLVAHRSHGTRPELSTAQIVVSGGVALASTHHFKMVERLAELIGGAVGATRAAVDAGLAPNEWQVGQTGKAVAPELYIAIGISGALQHLSGIQGAKTIVAINSDPEAPLMKIADIALAGDLFQVLPQLIAELEKRLGPA